MLSAIFLRAGSRNSRVTLTACSGSETYSDNEWRDRYCSARRTELPATRRAHANIASGGGRNRSADGLINLCVGLICGMRGRRSIRQNSDHDPVNRLQGVAQNKFAEAELLLRPPQGLEIRCGRGLISGRREAGAVRSHGRARGSLRTHHTALIDTELAGSSLKRAGDVCGRSCDHKCVRVSSRGSIGCEVVATLHSTAQLTVNQILSYEIADGPIISATGGRFVGRLGAGHCTQ